ncbi:MAG: DUF1501 domain-containing protein [Verrucomicrobiales bacterium]
MNRRHHLPLPPMSRREFLARQAGGIGGIALAQLLGSAGTASADGNPASSLLSRSPHHPPRAKNVIFLFMAGGPSHLDLLDPKPQMRQWDGKPAPEGMVDPTIMAGSVMASPRVFTRRGRSGVEFSDLLPHTGALADDLCVIRSLHTDSGNHDPAQLLFNCGTQLFGHPSLGSWVNYGLGSPSEDMPGYVVLNSGKDVEARSALAGNGFLPSTYRGVTVRTADDPILFLKNPPGIGEAAQRARLDTLRDLNRLHLESTGDQEIVSRIEAYEMAFRMQAAAPDLLDLSGESAATRAGYGLDQEDTRAFGTNCLLARRLVESGVRFVQLFHSTWDDHKKLDQNLKRNCLMTDQPAAALVRDLKQRGLLDDTLVIWAGEFGRTPMAEDHFDVGRPVKPGEEGRDHHPFAFSIWMAGGGVKGGHVHGRTDDFGYHVVEDGVHIHDLHATILHLVGLHHEQLTHRHAGRDFRLTDVAGRVVRGILA